MRSSSSSSSTKNKRNLKVDFEPMMSYHQLIVPLQIEKVQTEASVQTNNHDSAPGVIREQPTI